MNYLILYTLLIIVCFVLIIVFSSYIFGLIGIFLLYLLNYWFVSIPIGIIILIILKYAKRKN